MAISGALHCMSISLALNEEKIHSAFLGKSTILQNLPNLIDPELWPIFKAPL